MPTMTATNEASGAQVDLIRRLQAERGLEVVGVDRGTSHRAASAMIEALLSMPRRDGGRDRQAPTPGEDIGDASPSLPLRESNMLAAGRLLCTLTGPDGRHVTLMFRARVKRRRWERCDFATASHVFVTAGKDGDKVATFYPRSGKFAPTSERYGGDLLRAQAAKAVLLYLAEKRPLREGSTLQAANECGYCGRPLTDPVSIARGIGPDCWGQNTESKHVAPGAAEGAGVHADPGKDFSYDSRTIREAYFQTLDESVATVGSARVLDAVADDERLTEADQAVIRIRVAELSGKRDPNSAESIAANYGVGPAKAAEMAQKRERFGW